MTANLLTVGQTHQPLKGQNSTLDQHCLPKGVEAFSKQAEGFWDKWIGNQSGLRTIMDDGSHQGFHSSRNEWKNEA